MRRFVQAGVVWSIIWVGLLVVAYMTTQGAPVCEGPLITFVDESTPLQCNDPSAALLEVGLWWYAIGFLPSMIIAGVWQARDDRKSNKLSIPPVPAR